MATEYELKFKANYVNLNDISNRFPQKASAFEMETVYYDTANRALSARHYTLRRRLENGISVCTLKTPAGDARNEWATENDFIEYAIDDLIAQGAPEDLRKLAKEGLFPICGAKFTRFAKTITLENAVVELALDHGYLFAGNKKEPLCEVEVELKSGDKTACQQFAQSLAREFMLETEPRSKFARARNLSKGE